ncbi:protein of unknown function [Methanoculleus bourgensis]|uniref:Uncharacterized protein n=1 Tax=Methanoculleus bourgensis TaxID=83986 RepID=A0A0X3BHC5_9EURY|nr:protein of unknown function [Methanoculleus bourgensis]
MDRGGYRHGGGADGEGSPPPLSCAKNRTFITPPLPACGPPPPPQGAGAVTVVAIAMGVGLTGRGLPLPCLAQRTAHSSPHPSRPAASSPAPGSGGSHGDT